MELLRDQCSQNWPLFSLLGSDRYQLKDSFVQFPDPDLFFCSCFYYCCETRCMYQSILVSSRTFTFFFFCQISLSSVYNTNNASATLITCTLQTQAVFVLWWTHMPLLKALRTYVQAGTHAGLHCPSSGKKSSPFIEIFCVYRTGIFSLSYYNAPLFLLLQNGRAGRDLGKPH